MLITLTPKMCVDNFDNMSTEDYVAKLIGYYNSVSKDEGWDRDIFLRIIELDSTTYKCIVTKNNVDGEEHCQVLPKAATKDEVLELIFKLVGFYHLNRINAYYYTIFDVELSPSL